ncbi:DUF2505 domain-containing protein [Nocardia sp. alder85J]|uniref:DUF2505 domain-containing protein n=1 Tax=Nocardia sp. alder85J TaxID=2862949 RepID=UPI001CD1D32E|nr:DUF2505 domain-containing protein [Nocardia sp. alder85J]MCX4097795.1 DUF2505 domain-containing protein [Nocardia sp. alder85J]
MSRKFCFTVPYSVPVEQLHRAIIDDGLWRARFATAPTATLDLSRPDGPGTIRIRMTERARPDKIPSVVNRVLNTDLVLERIDNWAAVTGDGTAIGVFTGATTGLTTEMDGAYLLRPTATGSEIEVTGTVTVKVPLVGGMIEPLAEQMLHRVLDSERKFIEQQLGADAVA